MAVTPATSPIDSSLVLSEVRNGDEQPPAVEAATDTKVPISMVKTTERVLHALDNVMERVGMLDCHSNCSSSDDDDDSEASAERDDDEECVAAERAPKKSSKLGMLRKLGKMARFRSSKPVESKAKRIPGFTKDKYFQTLDYCGGLEPLYNAQEAVKDTTDKLYKFLYESTGQSAEATTADKTKAIKDDASDLTCEDSDNEIDDSFDGDKRSVAVAPPKYSPWPNWTSWSQHVTMDNLCYALALEEMPSPAVKALQPPPVHFIPAHLVAGDDAFRYGFSHKDPDGTTILSKEQTFTPQNLEVDGTTFPRFSVAAHRYANGNDFRPKQESADDHHDDASGIFLFPRPTSSMMLRVDRTYEDRIEP